MASEERLKTDKVPTQVNLDRSLKLLHKASGRTSGFFDTPRRSTTRPSIAATPTLFKTDQSLSFLPTPRRDSTLSAGAGLDDTSLLLGKEFELAVGDLSLDQTVDTTNVTLLLQEQSAHLVYDTDIHNQFTEIFQNNGGPNQIFDMLSAYKTALVQKTEVSKSILRSTIVARQSGRLSEQQYLHEDLRTEMWTWQLAESLLRDMADAELRAAEDEQMDDDDPHTVTTDLQLMEQLFSSNDKVRKCQIIIDWLETMNSEDVLDTFYSKVDFYTEKTSTMWENTLHFMKNPKKGKNLVKELDPDAPFRTGERLDALDQEDEERLLKYVFVLLRAGKLDEAQNLCIRCGQAWRAATLEGWRLMHDPNYTNTDGTDQLDVTGNTFRDVWKSAAWSLSEEVPSSYERAIYACLSGNLERLLPVCDSWYDALWAHVKVILDVELEQHLRLHSSCNDHQVVELPASYWARSTNLTQVFKELEASENDAIRKVSSDFYHEVQKYLILNDFEGLVDLMVNSKKWAIPYPHIQRFMAHLVLYLRNLDKLVIEDSVCEIVEEYIKHLVHSGQRTLVATYCAVLPKASQLITYAMFIKQIDSKECRRLVLEHGRKAGLDMHTITRIVTENSLAELTELIEVNASGMDYLGAERTQKVDDIVSSLDWLLFDPEQIMDAIHQCNAQMRIFLAMKRYDKLRQVFSKLPADCVSKALSGKEDVEVLEDSNAVKEYICFKTYLDGQQTFDDWFKHLHQAPTKPVQGTSRDFAESVAFEQKLYQYENDHKRWENTLKAATEHTIDKLRAVLLFAGGWMEDVSENESEDSNLMSRREQLLRLRQLCIPEVVSLLHKVLVETKQFGECHQLLDTVKSEDYQLYKTFPPNDLKRVMQSLEESANQKK